MTDDPTGLGPADPLSGLTEPRTLSLQRFPIRTRGLAVTRSGWRIAAVSAEGEGAIVLVESSEVETFFRGEGVFLGWTQERLGSAYRALQPRAETPAFELNQLG